MLTPEVPSTRRVASSPASTTAATSWEAVYVTNYDAATLTLIDPATNTVVGTLPTVDHPVAVDVLSDSIYVLGDTVQRIET